MNNNDYLIDENLAGGKVLLDRIRESILNNSTARVLEGLEQMDALVFDTLLDLETAHQMTGIAPHLLTEMGQAGTHGLRLYNERGSIQKDKIVAPLFRFTQLNHLCQLLKNGKE